MKSIKSRIKTSDMIFFSSVILSVYVRTRNLLAVPVSIGFRESQTAITVQDYFNHGYSLFNYKTPVFGAPWQVPFEFPVYQSTVYFLMRIFDVSNIDLGCRTVAIGFFYLSALALYFLCRKMFNEKLIAYFIVGYYVLCPYNFVFSRVPLPDYCSVFFGLCYIFFLLCWMKTPKLLYAASVLVSGTLGYLSKSTSMVAPVTMLAVLILSNIYEGHFSVNRISVKTIKLYIRQNYLYLSKLAALCVIPVIPGALWVKYTDKIKNASEYTKGLTSSSLKGWNWGSLDQRLDFDVWSVIFERINSFFTPYLLVLLLPIACIYAYKGASKNERTFALSSVSACIVTLICLINLYSRPGHEYYLIGLSPYIIIFCGYGAYRLFESVLKNKTYAKVLVLFMCFVSFLSPNMYSKPMFSKISPPADYSQIYHVEAIAQRIKEITSSDEYIIGGENGWSSALLYASNRRGYMMQRFANISYEDEINFLKNDNYTVLVTSEPFSYMNILNNYNYIIHTEPILLSGQISSWKVYKIYDDEKEIDSLVSPFSSMRIRPRNADGTVTFNLKEPVTPKYLKFEFSKPLDSSFNAHLKYQSTGVENTVEGLIPFEVFENNESVQLVKFSDNAEDANELILDFSESETIPRLKNVILYYN